MAFGDIVIEVDAEERVDDVWLKFDTETSATTPLGGGGRKILAKLSHFWDFNFTGKDKLALPCI